jgi:hypothetical protein
MWQSKSGSTSVLHSEDADGTEFVIDTEEDKNTNAKVNKAQVLHIIFRFLSSDRPKTFCTTLSFLALNLVTILRILISLLNLYI